MRSWEKTHITDILMDYHAELSETCRGLGEDGDNIDDHCIVIEDYLHETFGIEWKGDYWEGQSREKKVDK